MVILLKHFLCHSLCLDMSNLPLSLSLFLFLFFSLSIFLSLSLSLSLFLSFSLPPKVPLLYQIKITNYCIILIKRLFRKSYSNYLKTILIFLQWRKMGLVSMQSFSGIIFWYHSSSLFIQLPIMFAIHKYCCANMYIICKIYNLYLIYINIKQVLY